MEFINKSNYEKLLDTANKLKCSQGYYERLYARLIELDEDEIQDVNNIESLYSAKDTMDVIMYLEG